MKQISEVRNYRELLQEIKERIHKAQYEALRVVNKGLISLYWDIGKTIVGKQKDERWGRSVVMRLAKDLQAEFVGMRGFSAQNLWRMRQFYLAYEKHEKLSPLVREIGWSHNIIILMRCKTDFEREFYIRMTRKFGWSKSLLIHKIDLKTYEKIMLNQTNFSKTLPLKTRRQAKLAVKDEYTFDFLKLGDEHSELELERGLIDKINHFLVEMGGVFAFMGNQFRIEIESHEFFIDILLYHRRLKSLVAIELKKGEFKPEYAGKMQFYLSALDDLVKIRGENPSIGIILCQNKNRTIVEYTLRDTRKPIGVATYMLTTRLPRSLQKELPSPEQISYLLKEA